MHLDFVCVLFRIRATAKKENLKYFEQQVVMLIENRYIKNKVVICQEYSNNIRRKCHHIMENIFLKNKMILWLDWKCGCFLEVHIVPTVQEQFLILGHFF